MRILVFGDSITQGFYDTEKGGWCNRLEQYAEEKTIESDWNYDTTFFNLGVSGDLSGDVVQRFETELSARKDDYETVVILAVGINDSVKDRNTEDNLGNFDDFSKNYQWLIESGLKHGRVITIGLTDIQEELLTPVPWVSHFYMYKEEKSRYDAEIKRLSQKFEVTYISLEDLFGNTPGKYLMDGLHPNNEGHQLIFEKVKKVLEGEGMLKQL